MAKRRLIEFPAAIQMGRDAYRAGAKTKVQALAANPFKGFGEDFVEHCKYVNWNRGWNSAKRAHEENK